MNLQVNFELALIDPAYTQHNKGIFNQVKIITANVLRFTENPSFMDLEREKRGMVAAPKTANLSGPGSSFPSFGNQGPQSSPTYPMPSSSGGYGPVNGRVPFAPKPRP